MLSLWKFFLTFIVPIPQKALERKIRNRQRGKEGIQRESTLTPKSKDIDFVQSKSKKVELNTLPMNINGYVPYLINTLGTIVRGG